jgi:alkylated DNA repair dioxygenase AlkB
MDLFESKLPFELPSQEGYSVHRLEGMDGYRIDVPNGELVYIEHFFSKKISDRSVEYFLENETVDWRTAKWKQMTAEQFAEMRFANILWKQDSIKLYGRTIPLPRLTAWYGDAGRSYTYAGIRSEPNEWNKGLLYLKQETERLAGLEFNSVLLNWYRDGEDYLNWHADDEKELGLNPVIGSVNFGETRDFFLRRNVDTSQKIVLPLKHGTLLIMRGEIQHNWQHSVPKRKRVDGSRFNLTFRHISTPKNSF